MRYSIGLGSVQIFIDNIIIFGSNFYPLESIWTLPCVFVEIADDDDAKWGRKNPDSRSTDV